MTRRAASRARVLAAFGADATLSAELVAYDAHGLGDAPIPADIAFPLDDEPFVDVWREYARDVTASGFGALASRLVQLQFPIEEGISQRDDYVAATRAGASAAAMPSATGLVLVRPDECTVTVHRTWAGSIPIISTGCHEDFASLLRAFTARNEPVRVPDSQGACIVAGYNNWDRVRRLRDAWPREHPGETFSLDRIAPLKDRYQDRFILLSNAWYSGVPPERVGVPASEWQSLSVTIRREHESAHYWTRRVLASMRNLVLDEIIADYCGIVAACGRFRADWLLAFLGLDTERDARDGGRLHNYRGKPPLSDQAFAILTRLVRAAAENLETFDRQHAGALQGERGLLLILLTLSRMTLEELAGRDASAQLADELGRSQLLAARAVGRLHEAWG